MSDIYYVKLFDGLVHHYYVERFAFCALIKHIFETKLKKDKVSFAKEPMWQPLGLNAA